MNQPIRTAESLDATQKPSLDHALEQLATTLEGTLADMRKLLRVFTICAAGGLMFWVSVTLWTLH